MQHITGVYNSTSLRSLRCFVQRVSRCAPRVECGFKHVNKQSSKGFGSQPQQSKSGSQKSKAKQEKIFVANDQAGSNAQQMTSFTSEDNWRQLDEKVNKYPMDRTFTAVGTGGDDFRNTTFRAVQDVLGADKVSAQLLSCRPSSNDKYLSVKVGPVAVESADQVVEVYARIKADPRVKFCM